MLGKNIIEPLGFHFSDFGGRPCNCYILVILGCFKSSWPRTKFVLFQQLGMKIFPPSNLPRWCSDKAAASWPQGRGFESRLEPNFFAQSKNRKFLQLYDPIAQKIYTQSIKRLLYSFFPHFFLTFELGLEKI